MALILSIDTAVESAGICLSKDNQVLAFMENNIQKEHASWIHTAISRMLQQTGTDINALEAIAVTAGPGSYTGLRVGMATAKGLCFALKIPLITENTLRVIAFAVKSEGFPLQENISLSQEGETSSPALICPMIDARRMEVFTAVYAGQLQEVIPPSALILENTSFETLLSAGKIIFCGNGAEKWKSICSHPNARYSNVKYDAKCLSIIALEKFNNSDFTELVYAEPVYLKNFYTPDQSK